MKVPQEEAEKRPGFNTNACCKGSTVPFHRSSQPLRLLYYAMSEVKKEQGANEANDKNSSHAVLNIPKENHAKTLPSSKSQATFPTVSPTSQASAVTTTTHTPKIVPVENKKLLKSLAKNTQNKAVLNSTQTPQSSAQSKNPQVSSNVPMVTFPISAASAVHPTVNKIVINPTRLFYPMSHAPLKTVTAADLLSKSRQIVQKQYAPSVKPVQVMQQKTITLKPAQLMQQNTVSLKPTQVMQQTVSSSKPGQILHQLSAPQSQTLVPTSTFYIINSSGNEPPKLVQSPLPLQTHGHIQVLPVSKNNQIKVVSSSVLKKVVENHSDNKSQTPAVLNENNVRQHDNLLRIQNESTSTALNIDIEHLDNRSLSLLLLLSSLSLSV